MGRFALVPASSFKAPVAIHTPGEKPIKIGFNFRHRTRDALDTMFKDMAARAEKGEVLDDLEMIKLVATGWELEDEFNDENITLLIQHHLGSPKAIFETYLEELAGGRAKN